MKQADRLDPRVEAQPSILNLSFEQYEALQARQADVNHPTSTGNEPTG